VGVPSAPRGVPQIEVSFAIDSNGIVNVSARDMATNKSQGLQINPAGGLTKDEIERLVQEAEVHGREDGQRREIRRLKNRLEGLIYTNERVFEQFQKMLAGDDRRRVRETLIQARMALAADDRADLEAAMFDLNSVSRQLSELMLDNIEESV
jgi:molecular chaperone DnaK